MLPLLAHRFYGPHGVEPLNAASANTPSASSRDLILVIQNTSFHLKSRATEMPRYPNGVAFCCQVATPA